MKKAPSREWRVVCSTAWLTPDLFMRSYPQFDRHCKLISRHIGRTAARLHIPLEYNIGYVAYNEAHNLQTYPLSGLLAHCRQ